MNNNISETYNKLYHTPTRSLSSILKPDLETLYTPLIFGCSLVSAVLRLA